MRTTASQIRANAATATPAEAESAVYAFDRNAENFSPCGYGASIAIDLYQDVIGAIALLFFLGRPADIPGLVMALHIDPIQGVLGAGPAADCSQKLFKRVKTKLDAPSSIRSIRLIGLIRAAVFSRIERPHFRRWAAAFELMMGTQSRRRGLTVPAPARPGITLNQGGGRNGFYRAPAGALTVPIFPVPSRRGIAYNSKAAEHTAS